MTVTYLLFGGLVLFLLVGFPIAIAIFLSTLAAFVYCGVPLAQMVQRMFASVNSFTILAIPFFMLAGSLMETGGMSKRLVRFAHSLVCWLSGGLAHVQVLASAFFAALSGSAPATTAAMGGILIPEMKKKGYPPEFAAAVQSVAGTVGPIIPPSIPMVIYGVFAGESIGALFAAGILPGIIYCIGFSILIYFMAKKNHYGTTETFCPGNVWVTFKDAIWALLVPIIILGGIYSGIFTPTEAGAVAAVYGLAAGIFIYHELDFKNLKKCLASAAMNTAMVMLIFASSSAFSWLMTSQGVAKLVGNWFASVSSSPTVFLLLVIVLLMFMGCFMETIACILLVCPVLLPVATALGIDLVHFGIIVTMTLCIGMATPPVGECLYIAAGIAGVKFESLLKHVWPFIVSAVAVILLVTLVPEIALLIPGLLYG
ncbi:TRAP transporter large permease [uncultured Oscillibacter sp.]|uniref:TRAP transporter large permease n=1 Tax=uncultured Oscillibacter sp. TaxID=876091 RepID=UPI00260117A7|nr:TRAP transporter large permease [uncultured Oscillibacter sp.]